jgi:hypothetical protein
VWRSAGEKAWLEFVRGDPTYVDETSALDRSNIPSTPDCLLKEPDGFAIFLQLGKAVGRSQSTAIGEDPVGVPIMNYGRALREIGMPDAPGLDWRENGENVVETIELDPVEDIADNLAKTRISSEEELRVSRDPDTSPVKSVLTPAEQWELFQPKKFGPDAANLAAQYVRLVAAKEKKAADEREAKKEKERLAAKKKELPPVKGALVSAYEAQANVKQPLFESSVGAHGFPEPPSTSRGQSDLIQGQPGAVPSQADTTSVGSQVDPKAWPDVEDLSFAGFTNWIKACKDRYKKLGSGVCTPWDDARFKREELIKQRVNAWSEANSWTDENASKPFKTGIKDPSPLSFYNQPLSVGKVDREAIGLDEKSKGKGKGRGKGKQ